jgi:tetratricopeptide (TPR) repeat protein
VSDKGSEWLQGDRPARVGQSVKLRVLLQNVKPASVTMVGEVFAVPSPEMALEGMAGPGPENGSGPLPPLDEPARLSAMVEVDGTAPPPLRGVWHATLAREAADQPWALRALEPIVPAIDALDLETLDEATRRALAARLASQADELDIEHAPLAALALLALRLHPTAANVRRAASLFADGGEPERLARLADESLARAESEDSLLRSMGELYERLHMVDDALSLARRASERFADRWYPWSRLAALTKDDGAAERAADRAIELLGDSNELRDRARLHFLRAGMRFRRTDMAGAEEDYGAAATLAPEAAAHHVGLAQVLCTSERFEEAERACDRAIGASKEHAPAWALRAELKGRRGDVPGAMRDIERALLLRPKDGELSYSRAQLRRKAGEVQLARADLEKAVSLGHPRAAEMLRELAEQVIDVGSRVRHPKFGDGEVVGIEPGAGERKIAVAFDDGVKKTLLERFLERA